MSMLTRGRSRFAALGTAGALAASALVLTAPAAEAAPARGQAPLAWSISERFTDYLSMRTLVGGATFDEADSRFTFPADGVANAGDVTTYSYGGSVRGAFGFGGTEFYSVTVAEPQISIDGEGDGEITAMVSAANAAAQGNPASGTVPTRVTVAEFTDGVANAAGVAAVPNWAGVLPAASPEAVALNLAAAHPIDGQSFHPDFLGQLTAGVRGHFYASGADADPTKRVGSIAAAAPKATVQVTGFDKDYLDLSVSGTGFDPDSGVQRISDGIYVGVAPAGGILGLGGDDAPTGMAQFAGSDHVAGSSIVDGAFTRALPVETGKLTKGKAYALYTWSAHGNPVAGDSQMTETPLTINWSALTPPSVPKPAKVAPKVTLKIAKAPTTRKAGRAVVSLKGSKGIVTGKVKVQVLKGKKVVKNLGAKALRKGKLTVALPKRPKGTYKVKVTYTGSTAYKSASKAKAFKVRKR